MKHLSIISSLLVFISLACSPKKVNIENIGGKITYTENMMMIFFDPSSINKKQINSVYSHIFEGLVKFNPNNLTIEPCIAKTFEYLEEEMAFRFILNDNVYFHPDECFGNNKTRLLIANDIKYSFEKLCENRENNFAYFEAFKDIVEGANDFFEGKKTEVSGIKIINDFEIIIKLNQPHYSFLEKICSEKYVIIPKEAIKKYGHKSQIGSGPFILSEHNSLKSTLIKNENYYLKSKDGFTLPYLDTINIIYNYSIKDQINDFTNNKIDVITQLNNKALNRLRNIIPADKEVLYQTTPLLSTYIIEFNTITEPFNNEKFRKAINLAIDKQKITDIVADQSKGLQGNGGIVHPNISNYQSNGSYPYYYNIDSAKKLISEIINEQNNPISTINLEVNNDDDFGILIAQEIMFQLNNNLGLNVNLRIVTPLYKIEKTKYARGDMAISFIQASYDNPESFLINFLIGNFNFSNSIEMELMILISHKNSNDLNSQ
jgi:peptide/nickel transport system substrate-binding protein